ncbi:MAG: hypothetical protein ACFFBP_13725 [Promethearchaeota archaeon]
MSPKTIKKENGSNKKKEKKHLVIKTLILILIFLTSVEIYIWFWSKGDKIEPYEWGSRLDITYKINECYDLFTNREHKDKTKIVIIGDSRPECAFYPKLCDDYFDDKTISYNLAIAGTAIRVQSLLIQKVIIPKLNPDVIIWELTLPQDFADDEQTEKEEDNIMRTSMGRYYTGNTRGLDFEETCFYYLFKYSRIYRYRSNIRPNLFYLNEYEKAKIAYYEDWYERGYFKHYDIVSDINQSFSEVEHVYKLNEDSVDEFFETIEFIEENTDYFLVINGPVLYQKSIYPDIYTILNKLSPKNFLDLNGDELFDYDELWLNHYHLNICGATLYTRLVYEQLSIYI